MIGYLATNGQNYSNGRMSQPNHRLKRLFLLCFSTGWLPLALCPMSIGQEYPVEPQISESEMPRIPATEPDKVLDTFEIRPGFQLKLVAHEPDVVDPVAAAFDVDGGMYVVEMRGYSERREDRLGRIRYLQDTDGDGYFETSTIFKDGLKWPTGIVCYKGGVFVGATPDLLYYRDNDGDGICDEERLTFTGFGPENSRLNMQALFNSFRWGPDNRIWGATASSGGIVRKPDDPSFTPVPIRGSDFSFDPEKLDFRAENGTAQYGMTFDSLGRRFVSQNSRHAIWVAHERSHVWSNPYYELPEPLVDIPEDGAAAPVYRISYDEPWRVVRTRWRVSGVVKGMVEGGGRVSGYFTSASGIHAYWGNAYGSAFRDNLFIGDVGSNLVHRKILVQKDGKVQPLAIRPGDEQATEFLRSRDNWFRPASFATGPDGCLYICDMYRETIEHPWSLPPGIKKHLDLNSGNDRGRIYRIEPDVFERPRIPRLSTVSDDELLRFANRSTNDWEQTTARRLLYERGEAVSPMPEADPFPALLKSKDSLLEKLRDWQGDPWLEAMILNSLRTEESIREALVDSRVSESIRFEVELIKISGRSGDPELIELAIRRLIEVKVSEELFSLLSSLKEGVSFASGNWDSVKENENLNAIFARAQAICENEMAEEGMRLAALRILELEGSPSNDITRMRVVTSPLSSATLVIKAIEGIVDPSVLLEDISNLPSKAIPFATSRMSESSENALRLLDAIGTQKLGIEMLSTKASQNLRQHKDARVVEKVREFLPEAKKRSYVVAEYERALNLAGDPAKGKVVFAKACVVCHQTIEGEGPLFGPPVATFKNAGKASILGNVLDPNREVAPQYQAFQFSLKSGDAFVGMIASENERRVTVALPGGVTRSFPRTEVESMTGMGQSLMPEGLENVVTLGEMADLLAYLEQ